MHVTATHTAGSSHPRILASSRLAARRAFSTARITGSSRPRQRRRVAHSQHPARQGPASGSVSGILGGPYGRVLATSLPAECLAFSTARKAGSSQFRDRQFVSHSERPARQGLRVLATSRQAACRAFSAACAAGSSDRHRVGYSRRRALRPLDARRVAYSRRPARQGPRVSRPRDRRRVSHSRRPTRQGPRVLSTRDVSLIPSGLRGRVPANGGVSRILGGPQFVGYSLIKAPRAFLAARTSGSAHNLHCARCEFSAAR